MRRARSHILFASLLALASAPAHGREPAPGFIEGGGPASPPRGYVEMCRSGGGVLCDSDTTFAPAQMVRNVPLAQVLTADDATGAIVMPMVSIALSSLDGIRAPCAGAREDGASSAPEPSDLWFARVATTFRVDPSHSYNLSVVAPSLARQASRFVPAQPAGAERCGIASRASTPSILQAAIGSTPALGEAETAPAFPAMPTPDTRKRRSGPVPAVLRAVNRFVNQRVVQRTDLQMFGRGEVWRRSGTGRGAQGDCEDLAIEKRLELIDRGFPADRLFFAVVYRGDIGLHTVLLVRLGDGDYVLDSRTPYIVGWSRAPYSWISVQAPGRQKDWFAVQPRRLPHNGPASGQGIALESRPQSMRAVTPA